MTTTRTTEEIAKRVRDPGFTPGKRDVAMILPLLADPDAAASARRALRRVGTPLLDCLPKAPIPAPIARELCRVVSELPSSIETFRYLESELRSDNRHVVRAAARAMGRLAPNERPLASRALLEALTRAPAIEEERAIVESLGKVGDREALAAVKDLGSTDPALSRIALRARTMLMRTLARGTDAAPTLRPERAVRSPLEICLHARAGLEPLIVEELPPEFRARVGPPGSVQARLTGRLSSIFTSRLFTHVGFALPSIQTDTADTVQTVRRLLASPTAEEVLTTFTDGPARLRIRFERGGHRRALMWRLASEIQLPYVHNDPTQSTWELVLSENGHVLHGELVPLALQDPRFAYRIREIPAASHPTVAAALARVAAPTADDIVWDPFAGSALELIECARLSSPRALYGTDTQAHAVEAGRANLEAANVRATLAVSDARSVGPEFFVAGPPTLIVTNPPFGHRVLDVRRVDDLLVAFLAHAYELLTPGGRVVWTSPRPKKTMDWALQAGFAIVRVLPVDLGGIPGAIQVFARSDAKIQAATRPPRRARSVVRKRRVR